MVTIDEMWLIGGSDICLANGIVVRQPKLNDIRDSSVGFKRYTTFVNTFALKIGDMVSPEVIEKLSANFGEKLTAYLIFSLDPMLRAALFDAMSFFIVGDVTFDENELCFIVNDSIMITDAIFEELRYCVLVCAGVKDIEKATPVFRSEKARMIYEKMQKGRAQLAAAKAAGGNKDTMLPNLVSALCAKHPSINLCNVWNLTVWQLYDQFGRVCVNSQVDIVGLRWAAWGKEDFDFSTWYKTNTQ